VIARILETEPTGVPYPHPLRPAWATLMQRCLTKDVAERPRDIGICARARRHRQEMSLSSGARSGAAAELPSLAVLYFENLSSDSESRVLLRRHHGGHSDHLSRSRPAGGVAKRSRTLPGAPADLPRSPPYLG